MNTYKPIGLVPESKFFELGQILIEKEIVYEIRHHEDRFNLRHRVEKIKPHDDRYFFILTLANLLFSPFLFDYIKETPGNEERNRIKGVLKNEGSEELLNFYTSNKLKSSNLVNSLAIISSIIDHFHLSLDTELNDEFGLICFELSGFIEPSKLSAKRYKYSLGKEEKVHVAYKVFDYVERVLICFLGQIESGK